MYWKIVIEVKHIYMLIEKHFKEEIILNLEVIFRKSLRNG